MSLVLFAFAALFGVGALFCLLEPVCRRCRQRREQAEPRAAPPPSAPETPPWVPPPPAIPEDQRAGHHIARLVNRGGLLGLLFLPLVPVFTMLNARILGEAFELLLDRAGVPLGTLVVWGVSLELTDLHAYGLALALAELLLAAAFAGLADSPLRRLALIPLLALMAFEVLVSVLGGYLLALQGEGHAALPPLVHGFFRGLQAFACSFVEVLAGFFTIHRFLLPLLQGLFWGLVTPLRTARRWLIERRRRRSSRPPEPKPPQDRSAAPLRRRFCALIDEAVFDPLRALDRASAAGWSRLFCRRRLPHA